MAGRDPAISTRTELAKEAIPVGKHPADMAGSSTTMTRGQHMQYANS
jgi:hypothetical protein